MPAIDFGKVFGLGVAGTLVDIRANAVAEDGSGDVVVVGSLVGTADFDPGSGVHNLTSQGNRDAFVAEFSASGTLLWAETFRGQSAASVGQASAVAIDGSGNVEVAGTFSGSVNFDPGSGSTILSAPSRNDAYVVKLGSDGHLIWAFASAGSTNADDEAYALAPDGSGGVYIGGSYQSTVSFGTYALLATGSFEAYVAHIGSAGQFLWVRSTIGTGSSSAQVSGLAVDTSGDVILAGFYSGTVGFNPSGGPTMTSAGGRDVAVWTFDGSGNYRWADGIGGTDLDQADAVAVDPSGNIYVTGSFSGRVNFNPSALAANLTATGTYDVFVLKLSTTGGYLWVGSFAGSNAASQGTGIAIDGGGRIIVSGWYGGTVDFDPGANVAALASAGATDVFVAVLDSHGSFLAARGAGGTNSDMAFGVAVNATGTVMTVGSYTGPATFESTILPAIGSRSLFVAALNQTAYPPAAPSAPTLEAASDTGASPSDGVTSATSPVFDVTATSPGLTVQLLRDGTVVASRTGTGPVADPGRVPDGVHQYSARQVASPGGSSPASGTTQVTIDTIAPAAPAAPGLLAADDSGAKGDGITNINQPHLMGTVEPFATVQLYDGGGNLVATAPTTASGSYSIQVPTPLADGVTSYRALAIDVAGNVGPLGVAFSLTVDTKAPAKPPAPGLTSADDSGAAGDGITNVTRPHITGMAEPGSTVRLSVSGQPIVSGTADPNGNYTIQVSTSLVDGSYTITTTATDAATNVSQPSNPFTLTIDTTPPAAPGTPSLATADDSGVPGDGITAVNPPHIVGTAEAGSTVRLVAGGVQVGLGVAGPGGYSILLASGLADGVYAITATATDPAGNVGPASPAFRLTIDTKPPAAPPAPTILPADDSGTTGDGITRINPPRLSGTAEPGASVKLLASGQVVGTGTASAGGTYTITPTVSFPEGLTQVSATATDAAGNVSAAGPALALRIMTTPPAAPVLAMLAADDSGIKGDGITLVRHPRLVGVASPGGTVQLLDASGNVVATATASTVDGSFTLTSPAATAGFFTYNARAVDLAGNVSAIGGPIAVQILAVTGDFTGDGIADVSTYNPATAIWTILSSSDGSTKTYSYGWGGHDLALPADYDGDGKTDVAVFRPATDDWYILNSSTGVTTHYQFGWPGVDIPLPGDYDGIGRAEIAVYRPPTAQWFIRNTITGVTTIRTFGYAGVDVPVPADYDGAGRLNIAVFRPTTDQWFIRNADGSTRSYQLGTPGLDRPIPADFDGDGKADPAVYRPSTGQWNILQSSTGTVRTVNYGWAGVDEAIPFDYDGDGKADLTIYRPITSEFFITASSTGVRRIVQQGQSNNDLPAFVPITYRLNGLTLATNGSSAP